MVSAASTYATDICLPVGVPSGPAGNSSILTKTGDIVNSQAYSDFGCSIAAESNSISLNNCSSQGDSAIIVYADAPNNIPAALFTSAPDQVTAIYA
jgi:hypothetical protein